MKLKEIIVITILSLLFVVSCIGPEIGANGKEEARLYVVTSSQNGEINGQEIGEKGGVFLDKTVTNKTIKKGDKIKVTFGATFEDIKTVEIVKNK